MANQLVPQGVVNRLLTSLQVPGFPNLNITAPFLGAAGIRVAFEDVSTEYIKTLTGAVTSPQPFQLARITANLLKTQVLASAYRAQMESNALLGDGLTLYSDSAVFPVYTLFNCSIATVPSLDFAGKDADFNVEIAGIYYINSQLFQ